MSSITSRDVPRGFSASEYMTCLTGIVWREGLRFLHQGKILAKGKVEDVIAEAGGSDINTAFMRLTGTTGGGGTS